VKVSC